MRLPLHYCLIITVIKSVLTACDPLHTNSEQTAYKVDGTRDQKTGKAMREAAEEMHEELEDKAQ